VIEAYLGKGAADGAKPATPAHPPEPPAEVNQPDPELRSQ